MTPREAIDQINKQPAHPGVAVVMLLSALGYSGGKLEGGITEVKIDDNWLVKVNGTDQKKDNIPPFHFYIQYNGWPAGFINVLGEGVIANGQGANEGTFVAAILARLQAEGDASPDPTSAEHSAH